jgi:hypothetical protein
MYENDENQKADDDHSSPNEMIISQGILNKFIHIFSSNSISLQIPLLSYHSISITNHI